MVNFSRLSCGSFLAQYRTQRTELGCVLLALPVAPLLRVKAHALEPEFWVKLQLPAAVEVRL